jgi:hypothetical protein
MISEEIFNIDTQKQKEILKASIFFNKEYYINKYKDIKNTDPYEHYINNGWKENRIPSIEFDPNKYFTFNCIEKKINPVIHYEIIGKKKNYKVFACDYKIVKDSVYFDSRFYKAKYDDINCQNIDPIEHYINNGWKEKRIPSLRFDPNKYISINKIEEEINPIIHYETIGKNSGYTVSPITNTNDILCSIFNTKENNSYNFKDILKTKHIIQKIKNNNLKRIKILFISNTSNIERSISDGSTRYRCYHPAEALQDQGAIVTICSLEEFLKKSSFSYDIYIFHRPGSRAIPVIKQLKEKTKFLIADYDDLIFGPYTNAIESSIVKNNRKTKEQAAEIFYKNTVALNYFDNFTVSTEELANNIKYHKPNSNIKVINNFIPDSILKISSIDNCIKTPKDYNTIIYCSGTKSHDADFKIVAGAFKNHLQRYPNHKLYIFGELSIPSELNRLTNISYHPSVDYWLLFSHMKNCGYTISPLDTNKFNSCKSNVKFLESAVAGNYLLASPIYDFQRVADANIKIIKDLEWEKELDRLSNNISKDKIMQNYEYLVNNCSTKTYLNQFKSVFEGY